MKEAPPTGSAGYRTESADTSVEAEQVMIDLARKRTVAEKFARVWAMTEYVHNLAFEGMRGRHPELSDDEIRFRLTAQRLGPELTLAAYGRLPELDAR
jgi:hypothetical protein